MSGGSTAARAGACGHDGIPLEWAPTAEAEKASALEAEKDRRIAELLMERQEEKLRMLDVQALRLKRLARIDAVLRKTSEAQIRDYKPKQPWSGDTGAVTDDEECAELEPFFFDEAEAIADHERRAGTEKQKELERKKLMAAMDRIREYDPKLGRIVYTRIYFVNLMTFNHYEESSLGPMRDTEASINMVDDIVCKEGKKYFIQGDEASNTSVKAASSDIGEKLFVPCNSANVLSVKIVSSDVGFPIEVYGTVIARDSLDRKCVYLFRCDRDDSHIILTKDEELILIGPNRGLALIDAIYFEIDLKIKGQGKRKKDKQLSKGYLTLDGVSRHFRDEMEVETYHLDSMLSKVVVTCAVEKRAVEATISFEVVQGKFYGEIVACTTNIRDSIVLHDSKLISAAMTIGVLPMLRRVVAVGLKEKLTVTVTRPGVCGAERQRTMKFTPRVNSGDEAEITYGSLKMRVKVTWSIISRLYLDGD